WLEFFSKILVPCLIFYTKVNCGICRRINARKKIPKTCLGGCLLRLRCRPLLPLRTHNFCLLVGPLIVMSILASSYKNCACAMIVYQLVRSDIFLEDLLQYSQ